jgi:serine protease inhibitor
MGVEVIFSDSPDIARDTINQWKRERQETGPKQ